MDTTHDLIHDSQVDLSQKGEVVYIREQNARDIVTQ